LSFSFQLLPFAASPRKKKVFGSAAAELGVANCARHLFEADLRLDTCSVSFASVSPCGVPDTRL
jgi:hypothetical protein